MMTQALSAALLHFVWQGAFVGVLLGITLAALRRRSANMRYAVSCGALVVLAALPVVTTAVLYSRALPTDVRGGVAASTASRGAAGDIPQTVASIWIGNILQMVVETLFFYHPVVWWTSRQIRRERELCCDDLAVRCCGDAVTYARALTTLEKMRVTVPSLAMGSTGGPLLYRIQRLLGATAGDDSPSRGPAALAICLSLACVGLNVSWVRAQSQAATTRPEFDVASIKPTKFVPGLMGVTFLPGGRMSVDQSPLHLLIASAYDISMQQLDWPKTVAPIEEFYNIEAKAAPDAIPQGPLTRQARQRLELMLQALLADRFKLRVHREPKELPARPQAGIVERPVRDAGHRPRGKAHGELGN